ncbi:NUDIX domain-containing protein [Caldisalinibacter kiritimatiensis]|uniref:Dihydroneopterin triphosphate pyrophosphohydolase n=1 Tax=Caldisalinibacter kiritimatiensis TaxID=1304284 RepID=R1ARL8_9FIRM|nr:NUDIX domain-containing protein [Caldisalinibacter kiritimatiensis]EOC99792.1 Dihydroneopterin triphosphate pyrophosphohydolase [Caldisalinibacter kiritimatiensis]
MFRIITKALITKGNDVLILKRNNTSFAAGYWDIPGGKLEFGESLQESLVREVNEETSLQIDLAGVISTSSGINSEKKKQYITVVYLCNYLSGEVVLSNEHSEYMWVNIRNLKQKNLVYYVEEAIDKIIYSDLKNLKFKKAF